MPVAKPRRGDPNLVSDVFGRPSGGLDFSMCGVLGLTPFKLGASIALFGPGSPVVGIRWKMMVRL